MSDNNGLAGMNYQDNYNNGNLSGYAETPYLQRPQIQRPSMQPLAPGVHSSFTSMGFDDYGNPIDVKSSKVMENGLAGKMNDYTKAGIVMGGLTSGYTAYLQKGQLDTNNRIADLQIGLAKTNVANRAVTQNAASWRMADIGAQLSAGGGDQGSLAQINMRDNVLYKPVSGVIDGQEPVAAPVDNTRPQTQVLAS